MRRSLLLALLLVVGVCVAFVVAWSAGLRGHAGERVAEPSAPAERSVPVDPGAPGTALAPARVPLGSEPEPEPDPSAPAAAGDGQALLRVEVVGLEDGRALSGVRLYLTDTHHPGPAPRSRQRDRARGLDGDGLVTDAHGRGEFVARTGLAFVLSAEGPNGDAEQDVAPLSQGETRSARIALRGRGEPWSVRVLDGDTEAPIAGASVRVLNRLSHAAAREVVVDAKVYGEAGVESVPVAQGRTDAAGRFSADVPIEGSWFARIEAPGYHFAGCVVEPAAERDVYLRAPASLAVLVRERDGRPAAAVEVRLSTEFRELIDGAFLLTEPEWHRVTDAEGRCAFEALPPAVRLAAELCRGERVVARPGGERGELELDGGERRAIEWTLDGGCRLVGRAHDPAGEPLASLALVLESVEGRDAELGASAPASGMLLATDVLERAPAVELETDARGEFVLDDVGAGTWALGLSEDTSGFFDARLVFAVAAGETERRLDLRLERGARITGRVLAPDGAPARASVIARGTGPGGEPLVEFFVSGDDGGLVLYDLLPGEYRLEVAPAEPALRGPPPPTVHTGAEDVVLQLVRGAAADVRVLDAGGAPAARAEVFAFPVGDTEEAAWETAYDDDDGLVHLENLAQGTYDLVAVRPGEVAVLRAAELRGPAGEELVLRLAPAERVVVRTNRPATAGVRVDLCWEGRRISSAFARGEPLHLPSPPGPVTVRWTRIDGARRESFLHEESGVAGGESELAFDYAVE